MKKVKLIVQLPPVLTINVNVRHFCVEPLRSPEKLTQTFLGEDCMQNGYKITAENLDPNATTRVLTVDFGSGVTEFTFEPGADMTVNVPQDAEVTVTLHDTSTNPAFSDSETVSLTFKATDRNPPVVTPLASPGALTATFTGEVP